VAAVGGVGAAYGAMVSMGLDSSAVAAPLPAMTSTAGAGVKVAVLGAGVAGLVAAYRLERAGFEVVVLEARKRLGGRNWTVRPGDRVEMIGEETQTCAWEGPQAYLNAGPARLPSRHTGILGYCKELGVPLEVEVNSSRSAYLMGRDGGRLRQRQAINDTRGALSELLAKVVDRGALDADLTVEEKRRLLPFLKAYGDLKDDYDYAGSRRSGLMKRPGAALDFEAVAPPTPLGELLRNEQLSMSLFEDNFEMQATMFEPVGGMDQIIAGFERALKSPVIREAEVRDIRQNSAGVRIAYADAKTGAMAALDADYVVLTIPLSVLASIPNNFDRSVTAAIAGVAHDPSVKIAFEAPRFWEKDDIYGGISFVGGETNLVWYPSYGLHADRGVLLACYSSGAPAKLLEKRPMAEQIAMARAVVDKLHPGHAGDLSKPVAVNWSKVPYSRGAWPNWQGNEIGRHDAPIDKPAYRLLNEAHGRIHFAGAHLSQTPGWQEGAVASAHRAVAAIAARVKTQARRV